MKLLLLVAWLYFSHRLQLRLKGRIKARSEPMGDAPLKLSEAIRLNGMMKPQGRGAGSMVSLDAPCALGGALQSVGKQPKAEDEAYRAVAQNWPFTCLPAQCPCGSEHEEIRRKSKTRISHWQE